MLFTQRMLDYIVSARKYRPTTFQTVVGQRTLTTTLKNAIANNKLAHAYLFCGPRGVGKTTCARIFAKTINCFSPTVDGEACNECESCTAFNEQRSFNIHELDAASNNSVDDIRSLIEQVRVSPQIGTYKVYIIDEVHMLSTSAFNAFLKTLEEPPRYAIFILATTEKYKILPTILSRCQVYDFSRITLRDTIEHLKYVAEQEGINVEQEALGVIAQKADGGMRDALSIFDQIASFTQGNVTYGGVIEHLNVLDFDYYFQMTDHFLHCDIPNAMLLLDKILEKGFDGQHFMGGLAAHIRNLLVAGDNGTLKLLETSDLVRNKYKEQTTKCSPPFLYDALEICNECDQQYKQSRNKRLLVELTLIRLCQLNSEKKKSDSVLVKPFKRPIEPIFTVPATQTTATPATGKESSTVTFKPIANGSAVISEPSKKMVRKMNTFSIRQQTIEENSQKHTHSAEVKSASPFTELQLLECWNKFIDSHPDEHHLIKIMSDSKPQIHKEQEVSVTVTSQIDEKKMAEYLSMIVDFLRVALKNDYITIQILLNETRTEQAWLSNREKIELFASKNPSFIKLAQKFKLH